MAQKCGVCKKEFKDNYLGGIRDSTGWRGFIICGKCYNEGHNDLKGQVLTK